MGLLFRISVGCLLLLLVQSAVGQQYNPVANPQAVVRTGNARFTVLTDHVIRMEYAPDSTFVDEASLTFVNRNLPVPAYQTKDDNGWLVITTRFCTLRYRKNSGPFTAHNLQVQYHDSLRTFTWHPGQKDKSNLRGTTRTLDGMSGRFSFFKLRKVKLEQGILSRSGWALIDDSQRPLFDHSDWPWVQARTGAEAQDWYLFAYGSQYKQALFDFTQVAGKISMPPLFAFGVWYSRYWNYTDAELKDVVAGYDTNHIPLDVLVVDMDWHLTEQSDPDIFADKHLKLDGWTGFTWAKKYFPDYKGFLAWTDSSKLQTCLNIHPAAGVQPYEAAYPAFAKAMGVDTAGHPTIPFDITDKRFATNYFNILLHPYEKDGIDFWWLDWQQWGTTNIKGVNPTFFLNYVHFSDMQRQGKRPLIFHRWGGLGNHRYEIGFSGDYMINWKGLAYQPEFTATAANVGFGYWSHDIGGHMSLIRKKPKRNPELFTRWVQWGAFSPIFRTHATKDPGIERRMWMYPTPDLNAMRKVLQQRYALVPYIYTMARFAYDSGISIIRPMYYEFPDMDRAYRLPHQYYFGNNLLVAPITHSMDGKDSIRQTVWLPAGTWYDFRNNQPIAGGKDFTANYALDEVPVFVKGGSIIPMQTPKMRLTGSVLDTVILMVYPDQSATFTLYEDQGNTEDYRNNVCSFTRFDYQQKGSGAKLTITPDGKTYPNQVTTRSYQIHLISSTAPQQITLNGRTLTPYQDWVYNAQQHITTINTPKEKVGNLVIEVR